MRNLVRTLLSTAPLIHNASTPGGILKRAKYCVRGIAFARYTREWFAFLDAPKMACIVKNNSCLFQKLQRPYLIRDLNTLQRLEALKQHYQFVMRNFRPGMIEEIYASAGKLLAEFPVANVGALAVRLCCGKMQKEGDLTICLEMKESQKRIATLSFSVWRCEGHDKEIFVGGLQGDKGTSEDMVVSPTRGMYGLRPKALSFYVLQQLCASWAISRMRAVSDRMHIYRHFQSRRNVAASYDRFWFECGGVSAFDGVFDLPVGFVPREISAIRVNKRQLYRRRYAMLDELKKQILARLADETGASNVAFSPWPMSVAAQSLIQSERTMVASVAQ